MVRACGRDRVVLPRPAADLPALIRHLGDPARLVLTSATLLFAELLFIRWIPANVVYVGFFNNLVLIASFLGIGLGILLGRAGRRATWPLAPLLLFGTFALVYGAQVNGHLSADQALFLGGGDRPEIDVNLLFVATCFGLVTATMAALALGLGPLLRAMPPLRAYALDIAGSLAGIAAFAMLAALGTPPVAWLLVLAVPLVLLRPPLPRARTVLGGVALAATVALATVSHAAGDRFSPYYRVNVQTNGNGEAEILVNGLGHQTIHAVGSPFTEPFYGQIYAWLPGRHFARALVIGAGTGNDVAIGLAHGIDRIDAVEIDPALLALGVRDHPDRPYQDPRVRTAVNDGRAFLRASTDRYDLIVLALTDSLTLVTTTANVRLESFLFTREAFASARDHLTPDGVLVLYNYYREDWVIERYARTLAEAFGTAPAIATFPHLGGHGAVLAAGAPVAAIAARAAVGPAAPAPALDDWPFPYLRERAISAQYLLVLGGILIFAVAGTLLVARATGAGGASFSPHFFALGAAFLLIETRSITSFSLLFGTTWYVNALVFGGILASVLLAILVTARARPRRRLPIQLFLGVALAVAYLVPPQSLLFDPAWLRYVVASAISFAPVFAANLVFTYSFRDTRAADTSFASNLLGATLGGALEYVALVTGYQQLLLLVAALYLGALLLATRVRLFADRALA